MLLSFAHFNFIAGSIIIWSHYKRFRDKIVMKFRERNACKFQNLFLKRNAYMFHNKNVENIQSRHRNIFQGKNAKQSQENIAKKFQRRYRGKFLNIFQDIIVRKRRRKVLTSFSEMHSFFCSTKNIYTLGFFYLSTSVKGLYL